MNNTYILLMLVNTLTKAEKRYFHLCANLQNGDKVYLTLFNLIDANTSPEQLYTGRVSRPQSNIYIGYF